MTDPTSTLTNMQYTDIEDELRVTLRAALERHADWGHVLARLDDAPIADIALWDRLATELSLCGLPVPVDRGGAGATWREVAVVLEELGRCVAPVPFLGSSVLAIASLLDVDDELLPEVAAGARTAALAVPLSTPSWLQPTVTVEAHSGRLVGTIPLVADAELADTILVPTRDGLYVVNSTAAGVERRPVVSLDMTRQLHDLELANAAGRRVADERATGQLITRSRTLAAALLGSEQVGIADRCLQMTAEYLRTRYQFGRVLGSFQALKHRLADLSVILDQARSVARHGAATAAESEDPRQLEISASMAQSLCGEVAVRAAEECIQLHGGIGFTWEHPAHLLLKRARADLVAFGTPRDHRLRLAELVDLPGERLPSPASREEVIA